MRFALIAFIGLAVVGLPGCSRTRYRTAADRDSYAIIREKANCIQQTVPSNYSVTPDPRSRFFDATNPDCPQLPVPRPVLNGYQLPDLHSDTLSRAEQSNQGGPSAAQPATASADAEAEPDTSVQPPSAPVQASVSVVQAANAPVLIALHQTVPNPPVVEHVTAPEKGSADRPQNDSPETIASPDPHAASTPQIDPQDKTSGPAVPAPSARTNNASISKVTIPQSAWQVLPKNCLDRMLEFESLRSEYAQSFSGEQRELPVNAARKLTLANLMELATINSREYQTRKEVLFIAALSLTRRRYQFELNPSPFGNGTAADFRHQRSAGITQDRLSIPSGVGVQRTLATGGEFLARFANSVVLTFNGPTGFAADVGSEMIFDFQQTVFQRDIRFENLTQAERDVIYATRDYLRFRKQLFRDIANLYYNLLLSYRGIEINAQDYFTNLRGFIQSQAEYRTAEKIPRIQVDQFEQTVLRARSNLVNNVFALDASLDQLKFRLGLPTESPIFLDLTELESISLKDELSVARQMINRARAELLNVRSAGAFDATTLANVAEVLADRMANILRIQKRMESAEVPLDAEPTSPSSQARRTDASAASQALETAARELENLQQLLQILGVRMQVDILQAELDSQLSATTPAPPLRVLIRAIEFCDAELQVIDLALASNKAAESSRTNNSLLERRQAIEEKLVELVAFLEKISSMAGGAPPALEDLSKIPDRMQESVELSKLVEKLAKDATQNIIPSDGKSVEDKVQATVDRTIELSDRLLDKGPDGWAEIEIDSNEALLTGLVQRLDLMNQRGDLADGWRQIKLAGDDLRSIVDLRATQILRTNSLANDPLDFTFDDSETRLSVALDTPLNRRLQRNNFRVALISYNVGLRNLMAAEDSIKLDIREDLRQLALDRNQYTIAVASAALAYERVISTRLRLQFAVQNVAARDFLESQQAYTNALSAIARQHVNYITDRTELFFDLEAFDVDELGYWSGVKEDYGPSVNTDFPTTNPRPYDWLPPRVRYSPTIRGMECIPPGESIIVQPEP